MRRLFVRAEWMRLPDPGRRTVQALAAALAVSVLWAAGATWYLVFHDEVLARFVSQQTAMQYGYEERIGALRMQLDRAAIEQLTTREGIGARIADLAQRQAAMEKRQAQLSSLSGEPNALEDEASPSYTGSITPASKPSSGKAPAKPFPTPSLLELRSRDGTEESGRQSTLRAAETTLASLDARMDRLAAHQIRALDGLGVRAIRGAQRLRGIVMRVGLDPQRFERQREPGIGGPFVAIESDPFGIAVGQVQRALGDEARLRRIASSLPLRRPIAGDYSPSSAFGPRLDPFTRGLAMHTGLDMKAEYGETARATAAGRVTMADYNGGYGNMVEVDHGNGLATRYAHLSAYSVSPGQWIEAGTAIGRVGSSGRSTGSHLHYETRIDGEPVDPQRFLGALGSADTAFLAGR